MIRSTYRNYLLALLTAILTFNFVDRLALGIVLQDIKDELHLSDTQLGVLGGFSFALFYSIMGVPIARWADSGNRVTIISVTAALWSVAVALCGMAGSFFQLMLIRVGVAVGEAGAFAPALSLISDNFDRAERPRAIAIYTLAWPLSCVIGYFLAGWLNQRYGWRQTFMLLALPGIVLAFVAWFTLREPRKAKPHSIANSTVDTKWHAPMDAQRPELKDVLAVLWANASFRNLLLCVSVSYFFAYGILQWQPSFFIRSFMLTSGQVGSGFAIIYGLGGIVGTYLGGRFASHYAAQNEKLQLAAVALAWIVAGLLSFFVYLSSNQYLAFGLMGSCILVQAASSGPLFGTMQTLVPESMRAVSVSLVMLFANLLGMGFGPLAAGVLSDTLRPWAADESLRYALLLLAPGYLLVGWLAWRASKTVTRDMSLLPPSESSRQLDACP
jgi:MFS transporter, Spinster family, sphingosine-1-phosphate transporter